MNNTTGETDRGVLDAQPQRFEKLGMSMAEDEGRAGHRLYGGRGGDGRRGVVVTSSGGSGALETE
jgi:hypothetical protein